MKHRILLASFMTLAASAVQAQDMYDLARLSGSDLTGTARYVGMGGAMGALGADLTALNTNPAGLGLYRSSDIAFTVGVNMLNNDINNNETSRVSFDQMGVAIASKYSNYTSLKFINYGFNYRKHKNFFDDFSFSDNWNGDYSQTYQMAQMTYAGTDVSNMPALAGAAVNAGILNLDDSEYWGRGAYATNYKLYQTGGIQEYDFSLAANWSDQYFLGLSLAYYHAAFDRTIAYTEYGKDDTSYDMYNYYKTRGDGMNIKLGGIIRPVADSNFRFGIALQSPTYFSLTDENGVDIEAYAKDGKTMTGSGYAYSDPVDYELSTPWKFNFSLGHTIGGILALGAEYQLEDYCAVKIRERDGYHSEYTDYVDDSSREYLHTVHTVKLGAELKPIPELSIRAGYNYSTAIFEKEAYRSLKDFTDMYIDSMTETSYENTLGLHRLTCGVGYHGGNFYADMAFQYTIQKADFYPFDDYYTEGGTTYYTPGTSINKNRSQISLTLGYRF